VIKSVGKGSFGHALLCQRKADGVSARDAVAAQTPNDCVECSNILSSSRLTRRE
jgi:hypothetical protein